MFDSLLQLDHQLLLSLNQFAGINPTRDFLIREISGNDLVKGAVPAIFIWGLWFSRPPAGRSQEQTHTSLIAVAVLAIIAIAIGRAASALLPYRERPLRTEGLDLHHPLGSPLREIDVWSSFPSDHAVFYFALATALFLCRRSVGVILMLHAIFVICLPRVYLARHFPSDILVGAAVGVATVLILMGPIERLVTKLRLSRWPELSPATFYPAMFLVSLQMGTMFNSLRALLGWLI